MVLFSLRVFLSASVMLALKMTSEVAHAANTMQMGLSKKLLVGTDANSHDPCVKESYSFDVYALSEPPEVPHGWDREFIFRCIHEHAMDIGVGDISGLEKGSELPQEQRGCTFSHRSDSSSVSTLPPDSIFWRSISSLSLLFLFLSISYLISIKVLKIDPISSDKGTVPDNQPQSRGREENKLLLELDTPISQGERTVVYRGTHSRTPVAVKITKMMGTSVDASEEPLEAKVMKILKHPNIVALVVSGSYLPPQLRSEPRRNGMQMPYQHFIAMELCDRGTLHQLTKGTMPVDMVMSCAFEIAQAMHYIHSKRIIHGRLHTKHILMQSSPNDPRGFVCKVENA